MRALLFGIVLLGIVCSRADTLTSPSVVAYADAQRNFIFTVIPAGYREIESPLPSIAPELKKALADNTIGLGVLLAYSEAAKAYSAAWIRPLAGGVTPTAALVAEDGRSVVTFTSRFAGDENAPMATIYDAQGLPVKTLSLKDLIRAREAWEFPRTETTIFWGRPNLIDPNRQALILDIWKSGDPFPSSRQDSCEYESIAFSLKDGGILPPATKCPIP